MQNGRQIADDILNSFPSMTKFEIGLNIYWIWLVNCQ